MADARDFYEILGVSRDAAPDEIQRSYRKLARTYHPDLNKDPEAEVRFKDISEAYDVLSNPEQRKRYDAFGPDFRSVPDDIDPAAWERAQRAGRGRRSSRPPDEPPEWATSGVGDNYSAMFEDLFGQRVQGRAGWGPIPGADHEAEITLTLHDAFEGGRRSITLSGPEGDRKFDVSIPAGVTDGQRIRLGGQGGRGTDGAKTGDLYLVVHIAPHPRFRLDGRDVHTDLRLAPWEAALGTSVSVLGPGGPVTVKVAPGTSTGKRLRIRGRGMPNPKGSPGDLYADVEIDVPRAVSDEERRLFEELAAASDFDPRSSS